MAGAAAQGGVLGEGAFLSGTVRGQDLKVLGRFEGELHLEGKLHVGPKGQVAARVRAAEVVVEGEIQGEVRAGALTLAETARARGTFVAKRLLVKEGATVEGAFNPTPAPEPAPSPDPVHTLPLESSGSEPGPSV
jgi:cytoskeletal protein CcmA (bactofilin family)